MGEEKNHSNIQSIMFQGKPITVTHIVPKLTPQQRKQWKSEIENHLYDVFSKYAEGHKRIDKR
jgi:hypothetical protein